MSAAFAPVWSGLSHAGYAAVLVDPLTDGATMLGDGQASGDWLTYREGLVLAPGRWGSLRVRVPGSRHTEVLTVGTGIGGYTETELACSGRGHRERRLAVVRGALKARAYLDDCQPRSDGSLDVTVTARHVGGTGSPLALAIDSIELGIARRPPPVAPWVSLSAFVAIAALAGSLGSAALPWILAAGATGLALVVVWTAPELLISRPAPWGGSWNAGLAGGALMAGALAVVSLRPSRARYRPVATSAVLVWLVAWAVVMRWEQLETALGAPLWPDSEYVAEIIRRFFEHPYDTHYREPVWPWTAFLAHAIFGSKEIAMRMLSFTASVLVVPLTYVFVARYSGRSGLGLGAAALMAGHDYLIASSPQGHRTELLVLGVLAVGYFGFVSDLSGRRRAVGLGLSGAALALTSLNGLVIVLPLLLWAVVRRRLGPLAAVAACAILASALVPHFVYNYHRFGTFSWFTTRAVPAFYRNYEFVTIKGSGCDGCPSKAELLDNSFAGRPLSMFEYMFSLHQPSEVVARIAQGYYIAYLRPGPELGALLGGDSRLLWMLYLGGVLLLILSSMRELLLIPLLSLNLTAFVVPLQLDLRLLTTPAPIAALAAALPVYLAAAWVARRFSRRSSGSVPAATPYAGGTASSLPGTVSSTSPAATREQAVSLSVIVPVYNERHLVGASLSRLLALEDAGISRLQVVVVDDCSSDGSWDVIREIANTDERVLALRHDRNAGKGAALRTGLRHADGDVTVVHDADLEYDPGDIPLLLRPILLEGADAVFGSRYMAAPYRRALMYRHSVMNRTLTMVSNWFTDLDLTDVETCYKAVRTTLLKSIPLRSRDFRIEIELAMKLAKRRAHIFEVPIRYLPRSYREGKKIGARDGVLALGALVQFGFVDDIYQDDAYGSQILSQLERTRRFNGWMGDTLRPLVGDRVLEIGAGIGTLTEQMIPRDEYTASDIDPAYLDYLRSYAIGKPYLRVRRIDAAVPADFDGLAGRFDTVLMVNVLEHVRDEQTALANVRTALEPGGRAVILVPQHPRLYGTLDEALDHRERYTREGLRASLERAGFAVESLLEFNRASVPGWWLNGRVLRRRRFSRLQLKIFDSLVPLLRRIDGWLPYGGQSLIAVARRT